MTARCCLLCSSCLPGYNKRKSILLLNRQVFVPVPFSCFLACLLEASSKVWSYHRNVVCEAGYRLEEFAEQYEDAVNLDKETDQWPAKEDEDDACDEGCCALDFLATSEEEERSLDSEE